MGGTRGPWRACEWRLLRAPAPGCEGSSQGTARHGSRRARRTSRHSAGRACVPCAPSSRPGCETPPHGAAHCKAARPVRGRRAAAQVAWAAACHLGASASRPRACVLRDRAPRLGCAPPPPRAPDRTRACEGGAHRHRARACCRLRSGRPATGEGGPWGGAPRAARARVHRARRGGGARGGRERQPGWQWRRRRDPCARARAPRHEFLRAELVWLAGRSRA
jgi:hypothetical protein